MKIARFTSELTGVTARRLNDALQRQGVDSRPYYECGLPLVAGCQRVFEKAVGYAAVSSFISDHLRGVKIFDDEVLHQPAP